MFAPHRRYRPLTVTDKRLHGIRGLIVVDKKVRNAIPVQISRQFAYCFWLPG